MKSKLGRIILLYLTVLLALSLGASGAGIRGKIGSFAVYYSDQAPLSEFEEFDLLVFDSEYYPNLDALADRKKTLLGYLSLGEVEKNRPHFQEVKEEGILLQENRYWKGSFFVDVRDPRWTKRVIEELVPRVLERGFHGLFLDTLDNPAHLERTDSRRFKGMTSAAACLVKSIRYHYPTIKIMMNRAYEILPEVENEIDMVLGESLRADYNFETQSYQRVEEREYKDQVKLLQDARARSNSLLVFALDYWDPDDRAGIAELYRLERSNGFIPYVATIDLDRLVKEPIR